MGAIGIVADVGQGVAAASKGEWGEFTSHFGSASLGTVGLAIAATNPGLALVAGVGSVVIGLAEMGAEGYLNAQEKVAIQAACQQKANMAQQASQKFAGLTSQYNGAGCGCPR